MIPALFPSMCFLLCSLKYDSCFVPCSFLLCSLMCPASFPASCMYPLCLFLMCNVAFLWFSPSFGLFCSVSFVLDIQCIIPPSTFGSPLCCLFARAWQQQWRCPVWWLFLFSSWTRVFLRSVMVGCIAEGPSNRKNTQKEVHLTLVDFFLSGFWGFGNTTGRQLVLERRILNGHSCFHFKTKLNGKCNSESLPPGAKCSLLYIHACFKFFLILRSTKEIMLQVNISKGKGGYIFF